LTGTESSAATRRLICLLLLILVTGFAFQLRFAAYRDTVIEGPVRADAREYVIYAFNLKFLGTYSSLAVDPASGEQPLPDARRTPGYPLYLAMFIDNPLTYGSLSNALLGQVLMGTCVVLLTFLLASPLLGNFGALLAALLAACSPHLINAGLYLLTEILFALLLIGGLLLCYFAVKQQRAWLFLFAGIVIGLGALTRPALQYFPIALAVLIICHLGLRSAIRPILSCLLGFTLIYGPWIARNLATLGTPSDNSILVVTLSHGAYPDMRYDNDPRTFGYPYRYDPRSKEIVQNMHSVLAEIERRFSAEPARHLRWYLLGKPVTLWSWKMVQGRDPGFVYPPKATPYQRNGVHSASAGIMQAGHTVTVILGMIGALLAYLPGHLIGFSGAALFLVRLVSLSVIYWTVLHMVAAPFPRYSVPLRPELYALALLPLCVIARRITTTRAQQKSIKKRRTTTSGQ
jgi:4-amino-4-deoxy-L-arabinose transferase-like glycosyltransferase